MIRNTPSPSFQRCKRDTKVNQKSENKEESRWNGRKRRKKNFFCCHVLREEREVFFRYRPGLLGYRRGERVRKRRAQVGSGYLRAGMVSVFDALGLGVLTLDCRIPKLTRKQKRVNSRKSGAGFQVLMHHDSEKRYSKRRNS